MRFFAPQKIKFDEMSNGLVLDILKFYTAQMKEIQWRFFNDKKSLLNYEYADLMSFYDTESLIDLVEIDLEKYKKLKDFGNALRELVAKRAYLYLCKSSLSLRKWSELTARTFTPQPCSMALNFLKSPQKLSEIYNL